MEEVWDHQDCLYTIPVVRHSEGSSSESASIAGSAYVNVSRSATGACSVTIGPVVFLKSSMVVLLLLKVFSSVTHSRISSCLD